MKRQVFHKFAAAALIAVTLAFIWGNSLKNVAESSGESRMVLDVVRPLFELFAGRGKVTEHLVRKTAHFAEFAALGCEAALFFVLRGRARVRQTAYALAACLAAAAADEALQLLSDRSAQVSDVLLDFCGAAAGIAFVLLANAALRHAGKKRDRCPADCQRSRF